MMQSSLPGVRVRVRVTLLMMRNDDSYSSKHPRHSEHVPRPNLKMVHIFMQYIYCHFFPSFAKMFYIPFHLNCLGCYITFKVEI